MCAVEFLLHMERLCLRMKRWIDALMIHEKRKEVNENESVF